MQNSGFAFAIIFILVENMRLRSSQLLKAAARYAQLSARALINRLLQMESLGFKEKNRIVFRQALQREIC